MLPMTLLAAVLALAPDLARVLEGAPADSLLAPLHAYELQHRHTLQAAEAALLLGDLHVARAEYRLAADAYSRAAAGFDPSRKSEALYRAGIAWLGVPDGRRARALLGEVESRDGARRADATLGLAFAWTLDRQPERAFKLLSRLVVNRPGEAGAAALEQLATLAARLGQAAVARNARERLRRDYPRSFEAQGVGLEGEPAGAPLSPRSRP
jgi:tetratricopeptide (TPR) repeat protein